LSSCMTSSSLPPFASLETTRFENSHFVMPALPARLMQAQPTRDVSPARESIPRIS
jgi:hypothetical protein